MSSQSTDPQVEVMISKWIDHINLWVQKDRAEHPEWDQPLMDRDYFMHYTVNRMSTDPRTPIDDPDGYTIVAAYCGVADELNNLTLLGIFEDGQLIYATAEVDTSWAEYYRGEYPSGPIDTTKPYTRVDQFLNHPLTKETP